MVLVAIVVTAIVVGALSVLLTHRAARRSLSLSMGGRPEADPLATHRREIDRGSARLIEAEGRIELMAVALDALTSGVVITDSPLLIPVMRAGLGMLDAALTLLPESRVGFLGLKRNEETLLPHAYVNTVPDDLEGKECLILDPMLATGGSLIHTCDLLRESNAGTLIAACLLAAPEGIAALGDVHPDVIVWTAVVDDSLNDVGFIRPGLGDAGDRQFGLA